MLMYIRTALIALASLSVTMSLGFPSPAAAQRDVENAPDPYVHKVAGVAFPLQAGGFERGRVVEFDPDGSDASVGYKPTDLAGEVTLYLYPLSGVSCADHFAGAHEAVMRRSASILAESPVFSIPAFHEATQLSRSYTVPAGGYGYDHPELISFLWVGCPADSDWIVKYRASFLATDAINLLGIEQRFFGALDWSNLTGG